MVEGLDPSVHWNGRMRAEVGEAYHPATPLSQQLIYGYATGTFPPQDRAGDLRLAGVLVYRL